MSEHTLCSVLLRKATSHACVFGCHLGPLLLLIQSFQKYLYEVLTCIKLSIKLNVETWLTSRHYNFPPLIYLPKCLYSYFNAGWCKYPDIGQNMYSCSLSVRINCMRKNAVSYGWFKGQLRVIFSVLQISTTQNKCNARYLCDFKFSSRHIKKNKKEQLKLILFYLTIYSKYHSNM